MKKERYTEEQIISILKEHEAGGSVPELSRRRAVAENTIYRWKSKFCAQGAGLGKMVTAGQGRWAVDHLTSCRVIERRACRLAQFSRSAAW